MFRSLSNSRRLLAMLLVAILALVQVKIAIAGCLAPDSGAPMVMAMEDCEGCDTGNAKDSYDSLSKICSNQCLQSAAATEQVSAQPATAASAVAWPGLAADPPPVRSRVHSPPPAEKSLIHRFQRRLI